MRQCERSLGGSHAADSDMAIHDPGLPGLPRRFASRNDDTGSRSVCAIDRMQKTRKDDVLSSSRVATLP